MFLTEYVRINSFQLKALRADALQVGQLDHTVNGGIESVNQLTTG